MVGMADQMNDDGYEEKSDPSSSDDDSISLLHNLHVCRGKSADQVVTGSDFSSHVANKDMTEENGTEINHFQTDPAVMSGCTESTTECVASSPLSVKDPQPLTSFKRLHKRSGTGETLLHKACKRGDVARVQDLIQAGINVNMEDYAGWTALHEACMVGEETVVEELLKAGADVNAQGSHGVTPLHDAVCAGHYQVVMLLLRSGAIVDIRNLTGLTAVDMAEEDDMKELLQTFQTELDCDSPLSGCDTTTLRSRETNHPERDREPNKTQPRGKDSFPDTWKHCEAVKSVLEDVEKKHGEISTWPLTDLKDGDKYHTALRETHDVLTEVLSKQRWEKDQLSRKYHRSRCDRRQQAVLRTQLLSLASRQKDLLEALCRQQRLVHRCTAVMAPPPTQPPHQPGDVLDDAPHTEKQRKTGRLCTTQPGTAGTAGTPRRRSKVKGQEAALSRLVQRGVTPAGSLLQAWLKGQWHYAHVQADGSIQSRGKVHRAPELWLQNILGKKIPVSSSYARDKVRFQDKPLSCYLDQMEGEGQEEMQTAEAASSSDWMKVQTVCLVGDDGWLPNAVVDRYWNQLVYEDHLEPDDWNQLVYKDHLEEDEWNQLVYKDHLEEDEWNQLVYKDHLEGDD